VKKSVLDFFRKDRLFLVLACKTSETILLLCYDVMSGCQGVARLLGCC